MESQREEQMGDIEHGKRKNQQTRAARDHKDCEWKCFNTIEFFLVWARNVAFFWGGATEFF